MKTLIGVLISITTVAVLVGLALSVAVVHQLAIPDLHSNKAAELIKAAPEFNRYAVLVNIVSIDHLKDSMASVSYGAFMFRYLNSPVDTPPIQAKADFRYWEGSWHLNQFDYGCPADCLRIPMMSISHSDLMPIRTERSDAGLSQCEIVIDIRQAFWSFSL